MTSDSIAHPAAADDLYDEMWDRHGEGHHWGPWYLTQNPDLEQRDCSNCTLHQTRPKPHIVFGRGHVPPF